MNKPILFVRKLREDSELHPKWILCVDIDENPQLRWRSVKIVIAAYSDGTIIRRKGRVIDMQFYAEVK